MIALFESEAVWDSRCLCRLGDTRFLPLSETWAVWDSGWLFILDGASLGDTSLLLQEDGIVEIAPI